jgi:hypothetical protein
MPALRPRMFPLTLLRASQLTYSEWQKSEAVFVPTAEDDEYDDLPAHTVNQKSLLPLRALRLFCSLVSRQPQLLIPVRPLILSTYRTSCPCASTLQSLKQASSRLENRPSELAVQAAVPIMM